MKSLRVLTVDDETLALRRLRVLLESMPFIEHVGEGASYSEAIRLVELQRPDVILLDIQMRDGNGFDVIEKLANRENSPIVIFVSAFDHYAIQAFANSVVDYLLKPVERTRLADALSRARETLFAKSAERRIAELQEIVRNLRTSIRNNGETPFETEFWLRGSEGKIRIPIEAIECVSSEDDYVAIHAIQGTFLIRCSLRQFEAKVEPGQFVRSHRRWLVRKESIVELRNSGASGALLVLSSGRKIPAGRVYLKKLRDRLASRPNRVDA